MKYPYSTLICIVFTLLACNQQPKKQTNRHQIRVVATNGYNVPRDSIAPAAVVLIDDKKLKRIPVGKPFVAATNTNIHAAGIPQLAVAGNPRVCTPGSDTFKLPEKIPVIIHPVPAGIPEVAPAKDAYAKDQNPQNFITFKKLQGLKHGSITCLLQDKTGNLWIGTNGGGVSKYDGKSFTHFTENEGLSNNNVWSILEDKAGNIWFCTYGSGVCRYDGKSFVRFSEAEGFSNNNVYCILEDVKGNLWFGTNGSGVCKYDGKYFTRFTEKEGLSNSSVYSILEDKAGNLWFGTNGGGVSKYDGRSFSHFTVKEGLSNNSVWSILEDKKGDLWFGTKGGGVCRYDGKTFACFSEKEGLSNNFVQSIIEDQSGNIWIGTDGGGANKYDGKTFTHFTELEGLSNQSIWSMLEDRTGNLWFGTAGGGLSKFDGKTFTHFTEKEGLSKNNVYSILEDKTGKFWFGTTGGGVNMYDGNSFTHYTEKEGLSSDDVTSIIEDKAGNLWFGTYGGGVNKYDGKYFTHFTEKDGLSNNHVYSIAEDKNGNLWFGTNGGGVSRYDGRSFTTITDKQGLSNNSVWSILEDKNGTLWFGTKGGGLTRFDGKEFTHFTEKDGLSNNNVWSLLEDKAGNLWFGTKGGGVSKYDGRSFTHFTEKEGLSNNVVLSILQDNKQNLWFGTRFGLSKLTASDLAEIEEKIKTNAVNETDVFFKNYTYEDGFLGMGCNGNSIYEAKDGTIWIGANDRLTVYHPPVEQEEKAGIAAPVIQITSVGLFNETVNWISLEQKKDTVLSLGNGMNIRDVKFNGLTKWHGLPRDLSLAYNNNHVNFSFIGITMFQPRKVKYIYKLEGIDENWSALTSRTEAPYGNLPPGNYIFRVKAMSSEGSWSEDSTYAFTIRPPFWQTWWFRGLISILIIALIVSYVRRRERKLTSEKHLLERTVEERTAQIVEQKKLIEEKHKEITDSINYAERIQRALLASKELLDENLKVKNGQRDYFVLFKPKDVVSGDFYWAANTGNGQFLLVTADSTGHGVPGAIMSILNMACLKEASLQGITSPELLLDETRRLVIENLKNDGSADGGKDGMDGSLLAFDFENMILKCASANAPVWLVRDNELIEIKHDRMPIGKHDKDEQPFTLHIQTLQKGDMVYTLTDGFADQFGGAKGKKFKSKHLQKLVLSISKAPLDVQEETLDNAFETWKGSLEQLDDICVIGIKV